MKDDSFTQDVMKILEEAPVACKALRDNYDNLVHLADHCYDNYVQAGDSSTEALEETKNFATQSLASVAYQISTLASSVLSLLDAQTNQLLRMESSINMIGQTVEMHKEKVSRRKIGIFTAVKRVPRCHKILPPSNFQPRPPYSRHPINYQQLDGVGHGVKVSGKQAEKTGTIRKAAVRSNKSLEPVQCPVAPPVGSSSFGKAVPPPTIPPTSDVVRTLPNDATPPPPASENETPAQDTTEHLAPPPSLPHLPNAAGDNNVAPPPPPLPPTLTNYSAPLLAPPLTLETVVEENSLPSPSPPPTPPPPLAEDDEAFLPLLNESLDLLAPPPPPPLSPEEDDLEIPAPPPLSLDERIEFDDSTPPLPPPVDYDVSAPQQYMEKVVALYSYEASRPDDLSFAEGDVVYVTRRLDDGWCEGVVNGKRGFFPDNYVQSSGSQKLHPSADVVAVEMRCPSGTD